MNIQIEDWILQIMSNLTLEEKIGQMIQLEANEKSELLLKKNSIGSILNSEKKALDKFKQINKLSKDNIPILFAVDAIHGHCFIDGGTVFPTPLTIACSWDPKLVENIGKITAKEMRITGYHWTFAPNLDLARDPRWGRVNETFGEDTHLAGELGSAIIKGLQNFEFPVIACPKHFIAYGESIGGRDSVESEVSERKMRTLFLPVFQRAIDAGANSIMTAYQAMDGIPCTINSKLLKDILNDEMGFEGIVITDYDNLSRLHTEQYVVDNLYEASIKGFKAGNHVMMATEKFIDHMIKAVEEKRVSINDIDETVKKILRLKIKLNLFDNKIDESFESDVYQLGGFEHRELARKASEESIVLLKNNNDILPLKSRDIKLSVIGPNSVDRVAQLGDWAIRDNYGKKNFEMGSDHNNTYVSVLDGIKSLFSNTYYTKGCDIDLNELYLDEMITIAEKSDIIIAVIGDNNSFNGEISDRASLSLPGKQIEMLKELKKLGKPIIGILINGRPLILNWLDENLDAIIECFNPGLEGGNAIANVISGEVNPSGKLSISFPRHEGQLPIYYNQIPGWHGNSDGTGDYIDITHKPLYQFGFGLSYNDYEYSDLIIKNNKIKKKENLEIQISVKNKGKYNGKEIIQVYYNDIYSSVTTTKIQLVEFRKIVLKPNEKKKVKFSIPANRFSLIDKNNERKIEEGEFEIMIGKSSDKMDLLKDIFSIID